MSLRWTWPLITLVCLAPPAFAYQAPSGPTGVLLYDRDAAFDGFNLLTVGTKSYLFDMRGRLAKTWAWERGGDTQLLENGHLLRLEVLPPPERRSQLNWGGAAGFVSEYDWNGDLMWRTRFDGPDAINHHMVHRMPNGNTLVIVWERIPYAEAVARGRDPATLHDPATADCFASTFPPGRYICDFWPDKIVELDPAGEPTGWQWRAWDHMCDGKDPSCLDINHRFPIDPRSHRASANYMHTNAIDFDPEGGTAGHVIINSRVLGEFFVIDYASGAIVQRWGNPCSYGAGACPSYMDNGDQELFGAHGAHVVKQRGDPGRGHVLVFDNGWMRPFNPTAWGTASRALEVDLSTGDIVWSYQTVANHHSPFVGYAQALPNGNRLISLGMEGNLIEVTRDEGRIVWNFVNPIVGGSQMRCILGDEDAGGNFFFRVLRYAPDYAGLRYRLWGRRWSFEEELGERRRCLPYRLFYRFDEAKMAP